MISNNAPKPPICGHTNPTLFELVLEGAKNRVPVKYPTNASLTELSQVLASDPLLRRNGVREPEALACLSNSPLFTEHLVVVGHESPPPAPFRLPTFQIFSFRTTSFLDGEGGSTMEAERREREREQRRNDDAKKVSAPRRPPDLIPVYGLPLDIVRRSEEALRAVGLWPVAASLLFGPSRVVKTDTVDLPQVIADNRDRDEKKRAATNRALARQIHAESGLGPYARPVTLYPAITRLLASYGYSADQVTSVQDNASRNFKHALPGDGTHCVEEVIYYILMMKSGPAKEPSRGFENKRAA